MPAGAHPEAPALALGVAGRHRFRESLAGPGTPYPNHAARGACAEPTPPAVTWKRAPVSARRLQADPPRARRRSRLDPRCEANTQSSQTEDELSWREAARARHGGPRLSLQHLLSWLKY